MYLDPPHGFVQLLVFVMAEQQLRRRQSDYKLEIWDRRRKTDVSRRMEEECSVVRLELSIWPDGYGGDQWF